ncbi:urease accessory protein UreD, partial [Micromonospora provocatoris]
MRAYARLVARATAGGGTVLAELRGETPLLLRQTPG